MEDTAPARSSVRKAPRFVHQLVLGSLAVAFVLLVGAVGCLSVSSSASSPAASVFDDHTLAVENLDPSLFAALRRAAREAARDGVEIRVNSGWRSPEHQEQLLQEATSKYGSREAAARWVATPSTSPHVAGDAVDVGQSDAVTWLSDHGAGYGLCQIYRNEPWHYELRPDAVDHGCPSMYADPTDDPRMQP